MLSKNNIGIISTLILVILLSQSRVFDFLIDTALGRMILVFFILGISYMHKILGIIAVLFIIIMINQSDMTLFEGFTDKDKFKEKKLSGLSSKKTDADEAANEAVDAAEKAKIATKDAVKKAQAALQAAEAAAKAATTSSTKESVLNGREGFNMIDREGTMLKGKRSNEVPVLSNSRTQTDDVEPSDKDVYTNSYSSV